MSLQPFLAVLESTAGVKQDNGAFTLAEDLDATLFVTLGRDVMQVPKIGRIEVKGALIHLSTQKGERFFFPVEQIVGLSFGSASTKSSRAGAGFLPGGAVLQRG